MSRVKIAAEIVFFCFSFQSFFSNFERKFFRLLAKNLQEVFQTNFYVSRGTVCGLKFSSKVLNRIGFSAETFDRLSNFYLRVQSKIAEEKILLFFFSEFFRIFSENFFGLLAIKLQEVFKTTFCVSRGTVCGSKIFLKFRIVLDFLQEPLAWFSNFYLRVQSKNFGRNNFFNSSFRSFFRILSETFFRLSTRKLQEVVKSTFCVSRGTVCSLKFVF